MIPNISNIELMKLASGDTLSLQVYKFIGNNPGKKVYIQANLHGAEIVGNGVISQLIEYLSNLGSDRLQGEIWLVPVCNPLGTNQRSHFYATGRFNSYDGINWNRIFWDYEKESKDLETFALSQVNNPSNIIAQNYLEKIKQSWSQELAKINKPSSLPWRKQYRYILQSLCLDANYIIDIHSSSNQCLDFVFCFQERTEFAKYFLLEYGILMDKYDGDAFDEAFLKPWLALEKTLSKLGKNITIDREAWTLELGSGMVMNPDSVNKGVTGIKNYLIAKNILNLDMPLSTTNIKLVSRKHLHSYYAPTGGMIQNRLPLKTLVKKGDLLYQILSFNKKGKLPQSIDICSETNGIVFDVAINRSVNQGEYVLDVLDY